METPTMCEKKVTNNDGSISGELCIECKFRWISPNQGYCENPKCISNKEAFVKALQKGLYCMICNKPFVDEESYIDHSVLKHPEMLLANLDKNSKLFEEFNEREFALAKEVKYKKFEIGLLEEMLTSLAKANNE